MKALFNCSVIKNVYLRTDMSPIELEITYLDNKEQTWVSRKVIDGMSNRKYQKDKYEAVYETIKKALLDNDKFVEIEL